MTGYFPTNHEKVQVCCITLNSSDCIRLIGVPKELSESLRQAITNSWGQIQAERPYHGSHEFKLKGNPWIGNGQEAVLSRSLLAALLKCMAQHGWTVIQAADTSKKANDKDSLYFEYTEPDPEARLFALSFNMGDRIRLIDAPENMKSVLTEAVSGKTAIRKEQNYFGSYELKVAGEPWYYAGAEGIASRLLLCQILANFRSAGYKLYASVDISYGTEGHDLETWIFRKVSPPFWQ